MAGQSPRARNPWYTWRQNRPLLHDAGLSARMDAWPTRGRLDNDLDLWAQIGPWFILSSQSRWCDLYGIQLLRTRLPRDLYDTALVAQLIIAAIR